MAQEELQLNLARKWRSKQFDAVVGQELPVRILQNSLYLGQFFPVYLLSGQRGCGKTTMARLFAGAVNCQALELFQKNPKLHKVPCLSCASCSAMAKGSHPDFIEIDAASYTGVDNIRNIIDSAALLPVLGRKKIYLIDEAHMLSKAAFNAFLKILEEPPASVVFILATTDPHKIIETVRSRCFQLFFTSIPTDLMTQHLATICEHESIPNDQSALHIIASETGGSARDALNLLEQVRFSHSKVTVDATLKVLGHMPESAFLDIFDAVTRGDLQGLMVQMSSCSLAQYTVSSVWKKSTELVRTLLFYKQKLSAPAVFEDTQRLHAFSERVVGSDLVSWLRTLYEYELVLLKSTVAHSVLEMLFIELCQRVMRKTGGQELSYVPTPERLEKRPQAAQSAQAALLSSDPVTPEKISTPMAIETVGDSRWEKFMVGAREFSDPLLQSIFKQALFKEYKIETNEVVVLFAREATFFAGWVQDTKGLWEGLLQSAFGPQATLKLLFEATKFETAGLPKNSALPDQPSVSQEKKSGAPTQIAREAQSSQTPRSRTAFGQTKDMKKELLVDISDTQKWQKAHLLKEAFGGSVVEVQGHESHDKAEF